MDFTGKKQLLAISMTALMAFGFAGCGNEENQETETPEKQQNNHSDVNEDQDNDSGVNQDDQIEMDPNDENK